MKKNRRRDRRQDNPLAGELVPPPDQQFYSVGFLCQMLQRHIGDVHDLMRRCHVRYSFTHDGVGYVLGSDVVKMAAILAEARHQVEEAQAAPLN